MPGIQKTSIQDYITKTKSTKDTNQAKQLGEQAVREHGLGQQVQQQVQAAGSAQEVSKALEAVSSPKGGGQAGGAGGSQGAGQAGASAGGGCSSCGKNGCNGACNQASKSGQTCVNGQCNPTPPVNGTDKTSEADSKDGGNASAINGDNNTVNQTTNVYNGPVTINQGGESGDSKTVGPVGDSKGASTDGAAPPASPAPEAAAAPAPAAEAAPAPVAEAAPPPQAGPAN